MLNKVLLVGNVVKKPELQTTKNDSKVVTLIVATNESYKKWTERVEKATYHECVLWNNLWIYASTFDKGDLVSIEWKLNKRDYVDKNWIKRTVCEVLVDKVKLISRKNKRNLSEED